MRADRRGVMALTIVIIMSVVFAIAAAALLSMSLNRVNQANFQERRARARYAAKAGIVWAMQRLWQDPTWSSPVGWVGPPSDPPELDADNDGTSETKVDIIMPTCTQTPCEDRELHATVTY